MVFAVMKVLKKVSLVLAFAAATVSGAFAQGESFDTWRDRFRQQAIDRGISPQTVDGALSGVTPDQKVIDEDRKQPHTTQTLEQYLRKRVDPNVAKGKAMMQQHAALLEEVEKKYGVPPQYIVALWGMETNFGGFTGNNDVVRSLATLSWEGRRSQLFTDELLAALEIMDKGYMTRNELTGSWAGAFGQVQFMPSSYLKLAVDGDGDGRKDIRNSLADAFSSAANKLVNDGWQPGERWGRRVKLPGGFRLHKEMRDSLADIRTLEEWKKAGITLPDGSPLPAAPGMTAAVLAPDGANGRAYLVYDNYRAIRRWNSPAHFVISVGELADAIKGP